MHIGRERHLFTTTEDFSFTLRIWNSSGKLFRSPPSHLLSSLLLPLGRKQAHRDPRVMKGSEQKTSAQGSGQMHPCLSLPLRITSSPWEWQRREKGQWDQVAGGLRVATLALSTWQGFSHGGVPHSFQAASHSHTSARKRARIYFNYLASYSLGQCPMSCHDLYKAL